jgi:hypothetical protein
MLRNQSSFLPCTTISNRSITSGRSTVRRSPQSTRSGPGRRDTRVQAIKFGRWVRHRPLLVWSLAARVFPSAWPIPALVCFFPYRLHLARPVPDCGCAARSLAAFFPGMRQRELGTPAHHGEFSDAANAAGPRPSAWRSGRPETWPFRKHVEPRPGRLAGPCSGCRSACTLGRRDDSRSSFGFRPHACRGCGRTSFPRFHELPIERPQLHSPQPTAARVCRSSRGSLELPRYS